MPEGRIILAQAVVYIACAPKSNSSYLALDKALVAIEKCSNEVPNHLRDASYKGAQRLEHGIGYKYPHDYNKFYVKQQYLPDGVKGNFYEPKESGYEARMKKFMEYLNS